MRDPARSAPRFDLSRVRVAVVGSGIAGLVAAYRLAERHDLTVYEANGYAGGHTNTIEVDEDGVALPVDTGFIVANDRNYPGFLALMRELEVELQPTCMSFSVRCDATGLEYNGAGLATLFARRRNLVSPSFYRLLLEILRFNRESAELSGAALPGPTLGDYLEERGYSRAFVEQYIVPMGAAIWSSAVQDTRAMPARFFVEFFRNHGMLSLRGRPKWCVVRGGSRAYVARMLRRLGDRLRLRCPVLRVSRHGAAWAVATPHGTEHYDRVVLACHADQALALLAEPTPLDRAVLGAMPFQDNEVVLHTDSAVMPHRARVWASWNYLRPALLGAGVTVTYWMNRLQSLAARRNYFVSLNQGERIDPQRVLRRLRYAHPVFTSAAVMAQARRAELSGRDGLHYCGAYWGYGFHEDGVRSGLAVASELGA